MELLESDSIIIESDVHVLFSYCFYHCAEYNTSQLCRTIKYYTLHVPNVGHSISYLRKVTACRYSAMVCEKDVACGGSTLPSLILSVLTEPCKDQIGVAMFLSISITLLDYADSK